MLSRLSETVKNHAYYGTGHIKPELIVYEVTRRCNSRCLHCDIWKTKHKEENELTPFEVTAMLRDPLFSNLKHVILTGGEPTLRSDILDLIKAIHRHAQVWYSTNALLPNRVLEIAASGVQLGVGVSLDGVGKAHDIMRGVKGNFKKAKLLIHSLQELGVFTCVGFTLSPLTVQNYNTLRVWCEQQHVPLLVQRFDSASFYAHKKLMGKYADGLGVRRIVETLPPSILNQHWIKRLNGETKTFTCYALQKFFVLRYDGQVSPCLRYYHKTCGNVKTQSPTVIWNSRLAQSRRYLVRECDPQCLNDWAFNYSVRADFLPIILFRLAEKLRGKQLVRPR